MSSNSKNKLRFLHHHLLNIKSISVNPIPFFVSIIENYGEMVDVLFLRRFYITTDPEVIRHVFQRNNKNYPKTDQTIVPVREQIGNGLLTSEGPYWLKQRRAIQPGFHRKRLEDISKVMVDEINRYMDHELKAYAESGNVVELDKEMMHLAYRLVSKSLFGSEVADEKLGLMDRAISEGQEYIITQVRRPYFKYWQKLNGEYEKNEERKRVVQGIIMDIINERRSSGTAENDLLQMLLETEYEDGSRMSDEQLLDESLVLYLAGHETTALALTWGIYLLSTHSEVEEKLYKIKSTSFFS